MLTRSLRKDLKPDVYFNASFRIIYSIFAAITIYFVYTFVAHTDQIPSYVLLLCFLAGVAPIQILVNFEDTHMSKIYTG
jgi:hypothetical protein